MDLCEKRNILATQKLIYKLIALVIVPVFVSMVIFGSVSYAIFKEKLTHERIDEAMSLISLSSDEIKNPLYFLDINKLNTIVQNIKENPDVLSVYIIDSDGRVITDGTPENKFYNQFLEDDFSRKSISLNKSLVEVKNDILMVSAPAVVNERVGTIRIDLSLKELNQILFNFVTLLGVMGAIIFIVATAVSIFISSSISEPIIKLRNVADEIAKGNFGTEIDIRSNDEIGELAMAFNKMSHDLQKSNNFITSANEYTDNIVRSIMDTLIVVSEDGAIQTVNPAACTLLGYEEKELIGQPVSKVFADEIEFNGSIHHDLIKNGFIRNVEIIYLSKDSRRIPVVFSASVMHNSDGDIQGIVFVAEDITERKQAEEALKQSEEKYRTLFDKIQDGVFIIQDGKVQFANEAFSRIGGYTVEEAIGKELREFVAPEDFPMVANRYARRLAGENVPNEYEFSVIHKDGKTKRIVNVNAGLINYRGRPASMGTVKDVTERKRAEEIRKERAKAELYGFIVSALPVFASSVPSQVRNILVSTFAERFENNIRPRFDDEMRQLGYGQKLEEEDKRELLEVFMKWISGLFSNFGIQTRTTFFGTKRELEFLNCPWIGEARGNPIFCLICRTIVIRCFTWTSLKGSADQNSSIANGSKTCSFEIRT